MLACCINYDGNFALLSGVYDGHEQENGRGRERALVSPYDGR